MDTSTGLAGHGVVATAPAVSAKTIAAQASGQCSMGSRWKMKAKPDDGRMDLELEVDSNRNGQRWAVRITNDRHLVFAGSIPGLAFRAEVGGWGRCRQIYFGHVCTSPQALPRRAGVTTDGSTYAELWGGLGIAVGRLAGRDRFATAAAKSRGVSCRATAAA